MMTSTTFSLAGKGLRLNSAEDIKPHISDLESSTNFTSIDLSGNTLGVEACSALAPLLAKQSKLSFADLHDIFTGRLVEEIPPALDSLLTALLSCQNLHTIDLSDNAFGLKTKDPLVKFLAAHTPLQHLTLNNNGMGPIAGTSIAEALVELAEKKKQARANGQTVPDLESVVCGRNRLENGSMSAWAEAYTAHAGMKSVKMTQNGIRPEGIAVLISKGLSKCKRLEVFDLQDNTFTAVGASALATAIPQWPQLKELGVSENLLGARGSIKVFQTLGKGNSKDVEILRLEFNDITPPGLKALVTAAESMPKLRRIELNGNKFEEEDPSIEALSELLSQRKDEHGVDEDSDDHWGLGDLDELEGEDDDEEGDEVEEDAEGEDERERVLHEADEAESANVSLKNDKDVDGLADMLNRTEIK